MDGHAWTTTDKQRWFEQDLRQDDAQGALAPWLALSQCPVQACEAAYQGALSCPDPDAPAAVILAAVNTIWDRGRHFEGLGIWLARAQALRTTSPAPSLLAQASVAVFALIGELLWQARLPALRLALPEVRACVERADSDPLRIFLATCEAYMLLMAGELHAAQQVLQDAAHFAPQPEQAQVAKLHRAACAALLEGVMGRAGQGESTLRQIMASPGFEHWPAALQVMATAHHLYCLVQTAELDEVMPDIERVRAAVVPGNRAFHRSYMHFSLGQAELMHGHPAHALTHARMALELAQLCQSTEAQAFPTLLTAQALFDLERDEEALTELAQAAPTWLAHGFNLTATAAHVERAHAHGRRGQTAAARAALAAARALLPAGEPLPDFNRPPGYAQAIVDALQDLPARPCEHGPLMHVRTFGRFEVLIGDRLLYDRDWRGTRSQALLQAIVALGGFKVPFDRLADLFWPDREGDAARNNLKVALWRLRQVMIDAGLPPDVNWLGVMHGQVSIVQGCCDVDALRFAATSPTSPPTQIRAALALHEGEFIAQDHGTPWIAAQRERLLAHRDRLRAALPAA